MIKTKLSTAVVLGLSLVLIFGPIHPENFPERDLSFLAPATFVSNLFPPEEEGWDPFQVSPSLSGIPTKAYKLLPPKKRTLKANELVAGEDMTKEIIEIAYERRMGGKIQDEDDATLLYLDFNNMKLRNWIYTNEIVDVLFADIEDQIVRIVERVTRKHPLRPKEVLHGFYYTKGGDEKVIILPTADPLIVHQTIEEIKTYIRRVMDDKYRVAVLQLDDDSRYVTQGENKEIGKEKNDEIRQIMYLGDPKNDDDNGIVGKLAAKRGALKVIRHSEQFYIVYEDENHLEEAFLEVQAEYLDHEINFKPHAYFKGEFDGFSVTLSGATLKSALQEMNGTAIDNPVEILNHWAKRAEIGTQLLIDQGKDNFLMLKGSAKIMNASGHEDSDQTLLSRDPLKKRDMDGKEVEISDRDWIRYQSQVRGNSVKGQEDGRFQRLLHKKTFVKNHLQDIKGQGYLVQLNIGYMSETIRQRIEWYRSKFEEEIYEQLSSERKGAPFTIEKEELELLVRNKMMEKFRLFQPRITGANTKFINEAFTHSTTDELISAILFYFWKEVKIIDPEGFWDGNIMMFREPPDSVFLWFPKEKTRFKKDEHIEVLKQQLASLLHKIREGLNDVSAEEINLNFVVSVLSVTERHQIPAGNSERAYDLLENMVRSNLVVMGFVLKKDYSIIEDMWEAVKDQKGDDQDPQFMSSVQELVRNDFEEKLRTIDPAYSEVSLEVDRYKYLRDSTFFLLHNGNIEELADQINIDLANESGKESISRHMTEKMYKWQRELALAETNKTPNWDEMLYVLGQSLKREAKLRQFEDIANKLKSNEQYRRVIEIFEERELKRSLDLTRPQDLFYAIREVRQYMNERMFHLTGLHYDPVKGVILPGKDIPSMVTVETKYAVNVEGDFTTSKKKKFVSDGKSKLREVLFDPLLRSKLVQLRQQQRELLQFTRFFPLFQSMFDEYQELLKGLPLADRLLDVLAEKDFKLYHELLDLLLKGNIEIVEGVLVVHKAHNRSEPPVVLNSISFNVIVALTEKFRQRMERHKFSLTQRTYTSRFFPLSELFEDKGDAAAEIAL